MREIGAHSLRPVIPLPDDAFTTRPRRSLVRGGGRPAAGPKARFQSLARPGNHAPRDARPLFIQYCSFNTVAFDNRPRRMNSGLTASGRSSLFRDDALPPLPRGTPLPSLLLARERGRG